MTIKRERKKKRSLVFNEAWCVMNIHTIHWKFQRLKIAREEFETVIFKFFRILFSER